MNRVRCAVIGAGWWGTTAHVPALLRHPKCDLVAVQHRDLATAQKTADDFGVRHACSTAEEVLAIDELDAAVVSSTPNMHYPQAKAALERGLHVLIEKPMTITARQAAELVEIARSKNLQFVLSAPWHYTRYADEARRVVQSGALGDVRLISVLMADSCLGLYRGLPWQECFGENPNAECEAHPYREPGLASYSDPAIAGGGQIYCQVSHPAAYLSFLTGARPREVCARLDNGDTRVDVFDAMLMTMTNGTLVTLAATGATGLNERIMQFRLYGLCGELSLELFTGKMRFVGADGTVRDYPDLPPEEWYPMHAPAENLVDAILGDAPNRSPAVLGLYAMEAIDAAVESARTGKNITLAAATSQDAAKDQEAKDQGSHQHA
jgi:predicted dehydrogenase